jgi:hypothetical protein
VQALELNKAALARAESAAPLPADFFSAPSHHLARILRDAFSRDALAATMEVSHP